MGWCILSVDNGRQGYVTLIDAVTGDILQAPTPSKVGRLSVRLIHEDRDDESEDYDFIGMKQIVTDATVAASGAVVGVIEQPLAGFSGRSAAQTRQDNFRALGLWEAAFGANSVPLYVVHPSSWKAKYDIRGKGKDAAIWKAKELLPGVHWPSVDAADSYLVGRYFLDFTHLGKALKDDAW